MASALRKVLCVCMVTCGMLKVHAQQGPTASGGDAMGTGGSVSYSVGQVDYMVTNGTGGELTEGVQQPYEILVITGVDEIGMNAGLNVFPNPTAGNVILNTGRSGANRMSCTLYDANGQVILQRPLRDSQTMIPMAALSNATYFLTVYQNGAPLRSFQITKSR